MESENNKKKRSCVNAMYCSAEIADAVNSHNWLDGCVTGSERAERILQALNFTEQWFNRVDNSESATGMEEVINSQQQKLEEANATLQRKQEDIDLLQTERDNLQTKNDELEARIAELMAAAETSNGSSETLVAENSALNQQLEEAQQRITALESEEVNWAKISTTLDPAYVAVIEEITRRLIAKFNLEKLEPQVVLVTFFMKYYYCQEVEFSGMPFIIRPNEILAIVQKVYPEMTNKTLTHAFSVK